MAIITLDGRHLDVNESFLQTFDCTREQVIGRTADDYGLQFERPGEIADAFRAISELGSVSAVEMELRTPGGAVRIGLVSVQVIELQGEECAVSTFVDITERKRAERRARTQHEITRLLAEAPRLGPEVHRLLETLGRGFGWSGAELWQEDPERARLVCSGAWTEAIEGFASLSEHRTFGRGEGLPGRVWADGEPIWIADLTKDARFLRTPQALRLGLRSILAAPIRSAGGVAGVMLFFGEHPTPPDEDLMLTLIDLGVQIGHFLDRERAEAKLRTAKQLYERLVNTIDGIVWEADARTFCFSFVSPHAEKILGYPVSQWTEEAHFWEGHIHPEDREQTVQFCLSATREHRDHEFVYRMIAADGRTVWLHDTVTVILEHGEVVQLRGVMVDITARKLAEVEREQLYATAQEANRLKDEFLATLSHELRTPLHAILGWAQLLREGVLPEADAAAALESIERNAELQTRLVSDLLDVSRIVTGKLSLELQPLDPRRVVHAAIETLRATAIAKGVDLLLDCDQPVGHVEGDPDRLQQVVWNLLSNAIKFTPSGGRVHVALRPSPGTVEILVSDTGRGIDARFAPHVFDRFRQEDGSPTRSEGGLGLGLALVRHLVEMHGGTVEAASAGPGQGATFTVRLPASLARVARARAASQDQA